MKRTGLVVNDAHEAERTLAECESQGWLTYRLRGSIESRDDFFNAVRRSIPLDPPLESNRSWEALADCMWGGLDELSTEKIVLLWPNASLMERTSPNDFAIASDILSKLSASLADPKPTLGQTKQVLIIQVK